MTSFNNFAKMVASNPIYHSIILILITILIVIILKKKDRLKHILILTFLTIIIFVSIFMMYSRAIMPKVLETQETNKLEIVLLEEFTEIKAIEVKDVGGVELSITIFLNEDITLGISKEILYKIRSMLVSDAFLNDIQEYYWSDYYNQHSFEVKYLEKKELMFSLYAQRGAKSTNTELLEWDGYNHIAKENFKVILE